MIGKLRNEYSRAVGHTDAIRCAVTLAGLYSGAIGPPISGPWSTVAKIQWLLKAIELGSHAAVQSLMRDEDAVRVVEEFGLSLHQLRHPSFESPELDMDVLLRILRGFAEMPDADSANVLIWLGGTLNFDTFAERQAEQSASDGTNSDFPNERHLHQLERFTLNRRADFELVDSDAYDLNFIETSEIASSVYNNNLEGFVVLAEQHGIKPGCEEAHSHMAAAIFHGSLDIVRYLFYQYGVRPNDSWSDMSHINHSILFRRPLIVDFFLEHGAVLEEASGEKISGLHLVSRHDDPDLVTTLCENLKKRGNLAAVLESRATEGPMSGWTVAYTAMACRSWRNLEVLMQYGADPDARTSENESRLIQLAVQPQSPAVPMPVLQMLLEHGATPNCTPQYSKSPLQWAIGSSNVQAVFFLLLHGADVPDAALDDADETRAETAHIRALPVLDEDGRECDGEWVHMCNATSLISELLQIRRANQPRWDQKLQKAMQAPSQGWKGKLWISNAEPPSYIIRVHVPETA